MIRDAVPSLPQLYEADETAWLEEMADLIRQGRLQELDCEHLAEYLSDMAGRDRREVESRLTTLLVHILKWVYQPHHRTRSWRGTILEQRDELELAAARGVLRRHAEFVLSHAYAKAIKRATAETGLPPETFPTECPYTLEQLLSADITAE